MNHKLYFLAFVILIMFSGCKLIDHNVHINKYKNEILTVENNFKIMVKEKGIANAFIYFAAEDAILSRNNKLIMGKKEIKKYFNEQMLKDIKLDWNPDFVDVSKSGDLAYTFGKYSFSAITEDGDTIKSNGIFHTVWKKQKDGRWKYVWD